MAKSVEGKERTEEDILLLGKRWMDRITDAERRDEHWIKVAEEAEAIYLCGLTDNESEAEYPEYNILFANIETIVPSLYNSTPIPDVRPRPKRSPKELMPQPPQMPPQMPPMMMPPPPSPLRPAGPAQGAGMGNVVPMPQQGPALAPMPLPAPPDPYAQLRDACEIIESAIAVQIDDDVLDREIEALAQDAFLAGRGIIRVRFDAEIEGEVVTDEQVLYENVSWRDYREGPAKRWSNVPWVAFRHSIAQEEYDRLMDVSLYEGVEGDPPGLGVNDDEMLVWEVWDKTTRRVIFLEDETGKVLTIKDDPLGLKGFFPMVEPVQPLTATGRRSPVPPYASYQVLSEELERITERIRAILSGIQVKGGVAGASGGIDQIANANDNELVPIENIEGLVAAGGLEKAIIWWPIDRATQVLRELYAAREIVKQSIYEITGISDIVRGASNAQETARAQEIKTQWGSLRIKKLQRMIERQVRDLFRLTAEIVTQHFSAETLTLMTGIVPPEGFFDTKLNHLTIDVESDSTVRADLTSKRTEMAEFLNGTAQFFGTMAPLIQDNPESAGPIAEVYAAFSRHFSLGKQAEDAVERLAQMASQMAQKPRQNPEIEKIKADGQMKMQELGLKKEAEGLKRMQAETDAKLKSRELDLRERELLIDEKRAKTEERKVAGDMMTKRDEIALRREGKGEGTVINTGAPDEDVLRGMLVEAMESVAKSIAQGDRALMEAFSAQTNRIARMIESGNQAVISTISAPKMLIRDDEGRIVGAKTVEQ